MVQWRIYYDNGSTFDSLQGEPWQAPPSGVVVINQRHENPRERSYFQKDGDYYIWELNRWWAVDYGASNRYLYTGFHPHPRVSLAGKTVTNETYVQLVKLAGKDKDFYN